MDNWAKAYDQGTYINHPNYHSPTNDQNKYTDTNYEHKKIITQVNTNIILDREVHKLRSLIPEKFLAGNYRIHILRSATNYIKHLEQETYIDPFQAPYHHLNHNDDTNEQNKNTTRGLGEKYKITYTDQSTMITDRKFIMDDAFDELNCAIKHPALIHLTRIEIVKQAITYINFLKTDTSYDPFQIPCQSPDKPSDQPPPPYPSHFLEQPSIFPLDIISDFQECQNQNQSTSNNPPSFKEQSLSQDYLTTNNSFLPKDYGIQQNTPAALGITLNITPRNQQDNKEYFHNNIIDQSDNNEETSDSSINDHTGFCIDTLHNSEDSSPEQQNTSVDTDTDTDTADEGQKTSSTIIDQITELENNLDESDKQGYFCLQNLPSPVQENSSQHQQLEKTISPSENMTVSEPTSKKSKEHIQENAKKVYDLKLLELHKVRSLLYKIGSSNTHPPDKNLLTKSETLLLSAEIFKIYADHEKTEDPEIKETIREHLNRTTKKGHGNKKRRTTERKRNDLIAEYKILKKIFKDNSLSQKQVLTNTITKIKEIFPDTTEKPNIVASSDN
nr:hypothetical protein [Endozoicomonas sp.]